MKALKLGNKSRPATLAEWPHSHSAKASEKQAPCPLTDGKSGLGI